MKTTQSIRWSMLYCIALAVSSAGLNSVTAQNNNQNFPDPPQLGQLTGNRMLVSAKRVQDPAKSGDQDPTKTGDQDPTKTGGQDQVEMPKLDEPLRLNLQDQVPDVTQSGLGQTQLPPRPSKIVAEEFAGWREAGEGYNGDRLKEQLRASWVMVDPSGRLSGQVINYTPPVTEIDEKRIGMRVHLLHKGQLIESADVSRGGTFSFSGVKQSAYTIVGLSQTSFFAFSFDEIKFREGTDLATSLRVSALPAPSDFNAAWVKRFSPKIKFRNFGIFESKQGPDDPKRLYGLDGIHDHVPSAVAATSIDSHTVAALSDGRIIGRVHQIDSLNGRPVDVLSTTIVLTQGTKVIQHTSIDNFGVFELSNVTPGEYGLFAAGSDGIGAIGISVVAQVPEGSSNVIDLTLATSESVGWINHYLLEEDYLNKLLAPRKEMPIIEEFQGIPQQIEQGCPRDNRTYHNRCQQLGCQGRGQGNRGCRGGCQNGCQGGCQGGCQNGCQGGVQNGANLPLSGTNNGINYNPNNGSNSGSNYFLPNGMNGGLNSGHSSQLGSAFHKCEKCDQYKSECRCEQNRLLYLQQIELLKKQSQEKK